MDPLTLTTAVAGLIGTSFTLGTRLYNLYDRHCAASKEFEAFGREVKAFSGTWQMIQPCLEDARPLLSLDCLQILTNICNGTNNILKDVTKTIENFAGEGEGATTKHWTTPIFRARRIRKFFKHNDFTLQRSQLLYANTTLQLVLTVINYARTVPNSSVADQVLDNSNLIIKEQNRAREDIRKRERRERKVRRSQARRVKAIRWLDELPPPEISPLGQGRRSPFEQLANRWVTPDCRPGSIILDDYSDVTSSEGRRTPYRAIIDELWVRNCVQTQEMQMQAQQIRDLNQQMQQFTQDLRDVEKSTANSVRYRRERNNEPANRDGVQHELGQMKDTRDRYHRDSHHLRKENDLLIDKLKNLDIKNYPHRKARGPPPFSQKRFPRPPERGESSDRSTLC